MRIQHIGYLVKNIAKSVEEFLRLGYVQETEIYEDKDRAITICFMLNGGVRVELVAPMGDQSAVCNLLDKTGEAPYHICYVSDDWENDLRELTAAKYIIVAPEKPAIAFGGKNVAFLYKKNVGLIELVEGGENA